jgi:hypothetical protein
VALLQRQDIQEENEDKDDPAKKIILPHIFMSSSDSLSAPSAN